MVTKTLRILYPPHPGSTATAFHLWDYDAHEVPGTDRLRLEPVSVQHIEPYTPEYDAMFERLLPPERLRKLAYENLDRLFGVLLGTECEYPESEGDNE